MVFDAVSSNVKILKKQTGPMYEGPVPVVTTCVSIFRFVTRFLIKCRKTVWLHSTTEVALPQVLILLPNLKKNFGQCLHFTIKHTNNEY
jgi:hypothetical protein